MLLDSILFSLDDVREVRKVSVNIDDFNLYAREAQRNYLRKLIGDKLYTALLSDVSEGSLQTNRFIDLVNGKIYDYGGEIRFEGVKLYLAYVWCYLYLIDSSISITPTGAKIFRDEYAEYAQNKQAYQSLQAHFINSAESLEPTILKFLEVHLNQYPEFSESKRKKTAKATNNTFKIIGKTYRTPDNYLSP